MSYQVIYPDDINKLKSYPVVYAKKNHSDHIQQHEPMLSLTLTKKTCCKLYLLGLLIN